MPALRLTLCLVVLATLDVRAQTAPPAAGPESQARFAGEWVGAFRCDETGEHGVLVVRFGPNDGGDGGLFVVPGPYPDALFPEQVPLAFRFLTVRADAFRAALVRYDEGEWADPLDTLIEGTLLGDDRLEGTLAATGANNETVPQCGHWWAVRVPSRPPPLVP